MAAINFPDNPQPGEQFVTGSKTWRWNDVKQAWEAVKGGTEIIPGQDTPPNNPRIGDLWFDTSTGVLFYYLNDEDNTQQWVDVSAGSGDFETLTTLNSSSANWTSTFTTVTANSADWDAHTDPYDDTPVTTLQAASAEWDDTSSVVQSNSATNWDNTANTLESVTDNGSATLNDISVGRIVTLHPTNVGLNNSATGQQSAAIGGRENNANGIRSTAFGGRKNTVSGTDSTAVGGTNQSVIGVDSEALGSVNLKLFSKYASAVGAANSTIGTLSGVDPFPENFYANESFAKHSIILGGENIEIQHAQHAATVGGDGNSIQTDDHRSVILGGANITSDAADTAYVPNLNVGAGFKMPTGATDTYVLTTDASGVGTWQENQTAVIDLGVQADTNAAESAMTTNGFYTWTEADPDAYRQLSFKDSTKIWHVKEIINDNLTITVGGVGDDFATPADANRYLSHFDIAHNITVQVLIRPGTYTNQFSIFGHPHGERIFYKPFDAAAEPSSYPITSDFSTGTGDIVADEAMLRSKYPVVIETNTIDPGLRAGSGKTLIFKNCLFIGSAGTDKDGAFADEGAHIDCQGCTFFRFRDGIIAESGSDIRCPQVAAAWCTRVGFFATNRSLLRSSTNPGATIVWCNQGLDIYNSYCEINNIDLFKIQQHGIEVRHHSSCGENDDINVTADFCGMNGTTDAVISVRRNSYAKISNVNITNNITAGVRAYGNAHIYLPQPAVISTPSDGTSGAIELATFGTIETNASTPADFATDFTPILVAGNPVTPTATGVNDDYSYDGGVYGSILIT